jgi:hypothetical protein
METLMNDVYLQSLIVIIFMAIAWMIRSIIIGSGSSAVHPKQTTDAAMSKANNLNSIIHNMQQYSTNRIEQKAKTFPLFRAENKLKDMLKHQTTSRNQLKTQWREHYAGLSWWQKFMSEVETDVDGELITTELDRQIRELEMAVSQFAQTYTDDLRKGRKYFSALKSRSNCRLQELKLELSEKISNSEGDPINQDAVNAAWVAKLSVPISVTNDLLTAHQVYEALRSVNSNFAGMTDAEIWWETLWMSGIRLTGLVSLTKGSYLEHLVAGNTGGELHEHFNHADTDMVLDGIEYQIKATDSVSYINSVDPEIPVIATSEIADITNSIDSGYSNEELTKSVELALGGTVIDAGDTVVDAILTGAGSLGLFSTCRGINHASEQFEKGVEAEVAILEGVAVAVKGTAKGAVDFAEFGYKVTTSAPSRAVGRGLWGVARFIGRGIGKVLP